MTEGAKDDVDKDRAADILEEIGMLLELKGENPFKIRAYENGARMVRMLEEDLERLVREKRLGTIQGIGQALEQKLETLVTIGRLPYYEDLKAEFPETLFALLKIPGLGAKKVRTLYIEKGIETLTQLEQACREDRLKDLKGFGEKTRLNIMKGIEQVRKFTGRYLLSEAGSAAAEVLIQLQAVDGILEASIGGSLRRRRETVKDIDILVSARDQKAVSKALVSLSFAAAITGSGDTKTSLRTHQGIGVDVRVVTPEQYPYALHHFTGSKEHNTKMRQIAKAKGFKMNEYGLFREETGENVPCRDEAELFAALGMAYIPPELREDRGEIEAARTGGLPELVEQDDLKGLLHVHTEYSDGHNTVMQLAEAAASLGYGYLGIADHSRSAYYAGGLSEEAVVRQQQEIDALNEKGAPVQLFKGIESDILADGSLDYPEELLKTFDFVIASVHSGFRMDKQAMTNRIISAMKNLYTTILGHPTGRRLLSREGYDVDVEAVLKAAAETGAVLEINANPMRLDLDWRWLQRAKELGIRFAICPDAHEIQELYDISYGVAMARKGWLEKADIINSLPAADLKALFSTRRGG